MISAAISGNYNYIITNNNLDIAYEELKKILTVVS